MKRKLLALSLILFLSPTDNFARESSENPDLQKVLIIGDSISIGYTPVVAELLKDRAVVQHHKGNAEHTGTGLAKLDEWLGDKDWDLIHFNWGLWDLCYRHPDSKSQGKRDKVNGTLTTSLEQYEKNLDELVGRLKKTDAKLIWASTSVVPENEDGRVVGDELRYNEVAAKVMRKHGIRINDLHALSATFPSDYFIKPGDVHFRSQGNKELGAKVAEAIVSALEEGQAVNDPE